MDNQSQLQPPETFLAPLLQLRDYYAPLVEKYGQLYTHALANLNHVEALLSNWSSSSNANGNLPTDEAIASKVSAPVQENLLLGNNDNSLETKVKQVETVANQLPTTDNLPDAKPDVTAPIVISEPAASGTEILTNDTSDRGSDLSVNLLEPNTSQVLETENLSSTSDNGLQPPSASEVLETPEETQDNSLSWSEIPMLSEYESLNRTEAILQVLEKNAGTVCHIDFIVRSLYGELKPDVFKVVKGRVHSTLTRGRENSKWSIVPGKPGSYTLSLKLLNSNRNNSSSKQSKNNKPDPRAKTNLIPMLGEFEGLFLIDALTSLLGQNPGKVFSVAEVIEELYGELDESDVREVKPKVLNELSRGHRIGRFSRVPDEIGLYTWDAKLLQQASHS
ncbi:hypothetical protein I8752_21010 [Nostocaceae cyanobacterium CENA369]|uniref:Uncharacterized protein n=1 Tax=Dendronalium phyllosphericum CENA369 TaxID=1725256 RepID=A0A8J7LGS6_9NOST|nr:hypothetical protein [Dendronalium phyllosphericum]MBH8575443.1 hypothetical protein [Dendronalium phyllosphericum CENA369]